MSKKNMEKLRKKCQKISKKIDIEVTKIWRILKQYLKSILRTHWKNIENYCNVEKEPGKCRRNLTEMCERSCIASQKR